MFCDDIYNNIEQYSRNIETSIDNNQWRITDHKNTVIR